MAQHTRIYLDHAAATPLLPAARAAMEPLWTQDFGNASSPYATSRAAKMHLDRARGELAQLIGAHADEITWTSGGTESDNWALLGVALQCLARGERGHFIVSAIEHHAVLEAAETVRELGFDVDFARCDEEGVVHPDEIGALLRADTRLVSLMHVNNETGAIQPVQEAARAVHEKGDALFHTDAVQSVGKIEVNLAEMGVDLATVSGHKFGGPKGAGALWVKRGVRLHPLLRGGAQERGRRAGTENAAAIAGVGAAAQEAREHLKVRWKSTVLLRQKLEAGLQEIPGARINASNAPRAPHITNVSLAGQRAESLALGLDLRGIAVGTGSACASGALEPSHVLAAMGRSAAEARASLRVSLGAGNGENDIEEFLESLRQLCAKNK
jgi:cysteine desulfurase